MLNSNGIIEQASASSLLEDLKSQDQKVKINAIRGLNIIGLALGKERTRNELLPFIADCIDEEEDETLIELARVLATFLDYIGGKSHAMKILKILELLLMLDELSVRNEALISFKIILSNINPADYESDLLDLITRLATSEYMNQRHSAINLIPAVYKYLNKTNKASVVNYLVKFSNEDVPFIKKEMSIIMKDMPGLIDDDLYMNLVSTFLKDSNDSVRIPIMDSIVILKSHPGLSKMQDFINNVITKLSTDESWRVRLTVADKIHELFSFESLSPSLKENAVNIFVKLVEDKEAETRNICCLRLEMIAERIGKEDLMDKILSELKSIEKDTVSYVRAALASNLLRICPLIGKSKTNDFVFPTFLNLIKDESHDIRMTLVKTLDRLHEVINIDIFVQSIIPSLIEIANNKSWRIRIQIAESIPVLARILNKTLFMENILVICITWLTDGVYAIREAACKLMKKLYDIFRGEEFEKRLIEKLNEMRQNNSYLIRNTLLILAKEFANDEFDIDFLEKKLAPLIIKSSKDKISNVRMNSAAVLKKMLRLVKSRDVLKEVQACVEELKRDVDPDVINALNDN